MGKVSPIEKTVVSDSILLLYNVKLSVGPRSEAVVQRAFKTIEQANDVMSTIRSLCYAGATIVPHMIISGKFSEMPKPTTSLAAAKDMYAQWVKKP